MDLEARLARWEQRQETMIASLHDILGGLDAMRGQLAELVAWLQQPPSDELPDLIRAMIAASDATHEQLSRLDERMQSLPEKVARAMTDAAR
jgi:uncharacterized coiled-coil protein SlyX